MGFPDGASGKELTCQRRRHKRAGFDPWVWKIPWRRAIQPTPVFLPGESYGQRSLAGYSPWGRKESKTTERLNSDKTFVIEGSCWVWWGDRCQMRSLKATKADLDLHLLPEHRHLIYKDSCGPASALSWHDWSDLACTHTKVCVQYWGRGQRAPLEPRLSGFSEAAGCSVFFPLYPIRWHKTVTCSITDDVHLGHPTRGMPASLPLCKSTHLCFAIDNYFVGRHV